MTDIHAHRLGFEKRDTSKREFADLGRVPGGRVPVSAKLNYFTARNRLVWPKHVAVMIKKIAVPD
jgi:hypothetical protein